MMMPSFKRRTGENAGILIDTQALAWIGTDSPRLSTAAADVLFNGSTDLFVSAVTAYEFADLNHRKRFAADLPLGPLLEMLGAEVIDFPAACSALAALLPHHHFDPVDRMLIAHAIHAELTLVTADEVMRRYPVRSLW